ncbi:MAG: GxxExxY protein [Ardenticatenaceae bacterium]|nr:GxxExxY protein [Ardenticatenaceae bacterium]
MLKQPTELKHKDITDIILRVFFKEVYHNLGYGFLEKIYENAMLYELQRAGLMVEQQRKIDVFYDGVVMGEYFADLVVEDKIIVELKAASRLLPQHEAQLLNYLRATHFEVGLLLNFGPNPSFARKSFDNSRKKITWQT